jgi:hypothetical protein
VLRRKFAGRGDPAIAGLVLPSTSFLESKAWMQGPGPGMTVGHQPDPKVDRFIPHQALSFALQRGRYSVGS